MTERPTERPPINVFYMLDAAPHPSQCHACGAPCSARLTASCSSPPPKVRAIPSFYVLDSGAFNFSEVHSALGLLLLNQPPDVVLPIDDAQHMVDLPIVKALMLSPMRTFDRARAEVFVVGALPFASSVLGRFEDESAAAACIIYSKHSAHQSKALKRCRMPGVPGGGRRRHFRRMSELARALAIEPCFNGSATYLRPPPPDECFSGQGPTRRRKPILMVASGILMADMFGPELESMLGSVRSLGRTNHDEQHVVLASTVRRRENQTIELCTLACGCCLILPLPRRMH